MYEQQHPFKLSDFIVMSGFLNVFLYKAVLGNLFGKCNRLKNAELTLKRPNIDRSENHPRKYNVPIAAHSSDVALQKRQQEDLRPSRSLVDKRNKSVHFHDRSRKRTPSAPIAAADDASHYSARRPSQTVQKIHQQREDRFGTNRICLCMSAVHTDNSAQVIKLRINLGRYSQKCW